MGDLARVMSDIDYEDLERLRALETTFAKANFISDEDAVNFDRLKAMEEKFQKISKINPDEIDTIIDLRAGKIVAVDKAKYDIVSGLTTDDIDTLDKIRDGRALLIDADEMMNSDGIKVSNDDPFLAYLLRTLEWSTRTFGPAARTAGIIQHMQKEIGEIEKSPYDLTEWIDMIKLAIDGYWRHGGNLHMLLELMCRKQAKNFARTWPDWRTMSENQAIEHDRSGEIPTTI